MKKTYTILFFFATIFLMNCSTAQEYNDIIPEHQTFTLQSKYVNETRVINVWLPTNYKSTTDSFPVLYMPDGGLKEDFPHIANTIAELIQAKKIKPIILVGIENTQRRRDLTGFTEVKKDKEIAPVVGGSENFRNFIQEELIPEINKQYRTTYEKGIIGESLAGLFVTETFLLHPNMFNYYIAFDPSLWWNNNYLVQTAKEHLATPFTNKKTFWFAGSNTKDISTYTKQLEQILKEENKVNLTWNYSNEPKEKHNTIFRATKEKAIIWTIGEK